MKPIKKVSATDQVVENIKSGILMGKYNEGDKLPSEYELCEQLQVGRSTIREAYRLLQAAGYIEVIHGRGAFVARNTSSFDNNAESWFVQHNYQLKDIWDVRLAIEQMAARLAVKNMSDQELELLAKINESFNQAVMQSKVNQMALYDEYFHAYIVEGSHNQILIDINSSIADSLREYRLNAFAIAENRFHAVGPHQDILDALFARDYNRASMAIESHINFSIEDINRVIAKKSSGDE